MYRSKIELHNIDCLPFMKECKDNQFDLAIVDPPYGIGANKMTLGNGKIKIYRGENDWDKSVPSDEYFEELLRISNNQIIWGGNYFNLPLNNNWLIWDKLNPNLSFSEAELAWCSINKNIRIFKRLSTLPDYDGKKRHPTQKSIKLYEWILINYAQKGQTIFDSHLGSGSIAIACDNLGFDLTACEIDKEYFDAASKRLAQHRAQQRLF